MKRTYGWRRDTKDAIQALGRSYRATRRKNIPYPPAFDLGAIPNPAFCFLDQGQLGSCTGFGCKRVAWYGLNAVAVASESPMPAPEPSALFQYFNERQLDGDVDQDAGSTISQGINALKQFGICPEADWPYDPSKFTQTPPTQAFQNATNFEALSVENILADANLIPSLQDCLFNQKLPIVFGSDLFPAFESDAVAQGQIVPMPAAGESPIGGHCQVIRGWRTEPVGSLTFKINNSWGQWGDSGCDWMPAAYLQAYASDFWAIVKMM